MFDNVSLCERKIESKKNRIKLRLDLQTKKRKSTLGQVRLDVDY